MLLKDIGQVLKYINENIDQRKSLDVRNNVMTKVYEPHNDCYDSIEEWKQSITINIHNNMCFHCTDEFDLFL